MTVLKKILSPILCNLFSYFFFIALQYIKITWVSWSHEKALCGMTPWEMSNNSRMGLQFALSSACSLPRKSWWRWHTLQQEISQAVRLLCYHPSPSLCRLHTVHLLDFCDGFPLLFYLSHFLSPIPSSVMIIMGSREILPQNHLPSGVAENIDTSMSFKTLSLFLSFKFCPLNWSSILSALLLCKLWGNILSCVPYWCWVGYKQW